jgi:hypothetical protein
MVLLLLHGHKYSLFSTATKENGRRGGTSAARDCCTAANAHAARLWSDGGSNAQARDLLAPIYGWFTEGFGTLDSKEAKILLDTLAP